MTIPDNIESLVNMTWLKNEAHVEEQLIKPVKANKWVCCTIEYYARASPDETHVQYAAWVMYGLLGKKFSVPQVSTETMYGAHIDGETPEELMAKFREHPDYFNALEFIEQYSRKDTVQNPQQILTAGVMVCKILHAQREIDAMENIFT